MASASQKFKPSKWKKPSNEPVNITKEKDENIKELQSLHSMSRVSLFKEKLNNTDGDTPVDVINNIDEDEKIEVKVEEVVDEVVDEVVPKAPKRTVKTIVEGAAKLIKAEANIGMASHEIVTDRYSICNSSDTNNNGRCEGSGGCGCWIAPKIRLF